MDITIAFMVYGVVFVAYLWHNYVTIKIKRELITMCENEEKAWLLETYDKLKEAEKNIQESNVVDALSHLKELQARYGL
ncbi:MAG: hypothetical protein LUH42_04695 [Oscillospiraceae bacterium]|nr:hypothetical protein [Oscillospiraceae bacterium]